MLPTDIAGSVTLHQPFGLPTCKIKYPCFKCGQPGHLAYDKECPRFGEDLTMEEKRQKGKHIFMVEIEPNRLERLVHDFNKYYNDYHSTTNADGRMGYYKKQLELNPKAVSELKGYSEIDPLKQYKDEYVKEEFKDEDEKFLDSLGPTERKILFTTIRRVIRDEKRKKKIKLLEEEKYNLADNIIISDDSESDGEYELGCNAVESEFTDALDELVFGKDEQDKKEIKPKVADDPLFSHLAAEIAENKNDLASKEEQMRKRLTQRKCQLMIKQKNLEEEMKRHREEMELDNDPLAEAVMVYVAEGDTQKEVEINMKLLEEEKKKKLRSESKKNKKKIKK